MNGGAGGHRGVHQVWKLQPDPCCQRTWVRASERHPLPVGQPPGRRHHCAEVSQVCQGLTTAEEPQVVCAEVPECNTEEGLTSRTVEQSRHLLVLFNLI